jgi:hypothetical protein
MPLYAALVIFLGVLIYLFVAAKHRKDLPQKAVPLNPKQSMVLPDVNSLKATDISEG